MYWKKVKSLILDFTLVSKLLPPQFLLLPYKEVITLRQRGQKPNVYSKAVHLPPSSNLMAEDKNTYELDVRASARSMFFELHSGGMHLLAGRACILNQPNLLKRPDDFTYIDRIRLGVLVIRNLDDCF